MVICAGLRDASADGTGREGNTPYMLLGHIDQVDRKHVRGWAADTDRPYGTIEVAVFVGGRLVGLARADQTRDDLKDSVSLGSGQHGIIYQFEPPLARSQDHEVVVRFAEGGKLLGQWRVAREPEVAQPAEPVEPPAPPAASQVTIAVPAPIVSGALPGHVPIGFVDECTRQRVKGWAASETKTDEVFDLSVFVDDRKVAQLPANIPREDLAESGLYRDGARGFLHEFDPPLPEGRDVRVTVTYARTGIPVTNGDALLVGDQRIKIERQSSLTEDEPRLLRAPVGPRQLFEFLGLHTSDEHLVRLLERLTFDDVSPEQIHYGVFGGYPDSVEDVSQWGTYYGRDHLHQLLISEQFQKQLILLFLRAFPEKRRLIFVHIPKCAGTDLTFHFRARYPSLERALTDPDWTPKTAMLHRIARVVSHVHASDSVFVHGHINLKDYIADDLIRPKDRVFTVIREPFAIAVSQINYVLTQFNEDIAKGKAEPDTLEWSRVMGLGPLPKHMSDDFIKLLAKAVLRNEDLVLPNSVGSWLGGEGGQAVLDRLVRHNVEVTDTDRYSRWLQQSWGIMADTRWNESKKFVSLEDLTQEDLIYLQKITAEDRRLYRSIQQVFDATGKIALNAEDLRGVIVR